MSIFGEQFLARRNRDQIDLDNALQDVYEAVTGRESIRYSINSDEQVRKELERICFYLGVRADQDVPEYNDLEDMLDYITRPFAIMRRHILLTHHWWKNGDGPLLVSKKDSDELLALIPGRLGGYYYTDFRSNKKIKIDRHNAGEFEKEAICFYKPLPLSSLSANELTGLLFKNMAATDLAMLVLSGIGIVGVSLLIPFATKMVFEYVIPTGAMTLVGSFSFLLISSAMVAYIIAVIKQGYADRVKVRMEVYLTHGVMGRMINFPTSFFASKSTGELYRVFDNLREIPQILIDSVIVPIIDIGLAMLFIIQIAVIVPELLVPAIITALLQFVCMAIGTFQAYGLLNVELQQDRKIQGLAISVYEGIQRIKLSGSESRIMAKWAGLYSKKAKVAYPAVFPVKFQTELIAFISMMGMLAAFYKGFRDNISIPQFVAFVAAFGMLTGSITAFSNKSKDVIKLKPVLKMADEILKECPEVSKEKLIVDHLSGKIEVKDLTFRYGRDLPLILDGVSFTVHPGEYVAIVGKSGCGKSTLVRIFMGFEKAVSGSVSYDDIDVERIDPRSLRRSIGVVMQSGNLFHDSIYRNIAISAPGLSMEEAWEAAEKAGIAEDIRNMPMKMKTLIPQGGGGISGGQRQRIMIARALAAKPNILIFDEATSALDNITQKVVQDSLDQLNCTRIVIAHRLSTIQNCDRILVLDKGRIIEEGNYQELLKKGGFFANLIKRQQL